jgi:hypothetical protein
MKDLIAALQIFAKYAPDEYAPTHCEHDVLYVTCVKYDDVSDEDKAALDKLGFHESEYNGFQSYRYGSS